LKTAFVCADAGESGGKVAAAPMAALNLIKSRRLILISLHVPRRFIFSGRSTNHVLRDLSTILRNFLG
jgi:hypothetical protein